MVPIVTISLYAAATRLGITAPEGHQIFTITLVTAAGCISKGFYILQLAILDCALCSSSQGYFSHYTLLLNFILSFHPSNSICLDNLKYDNQIAFDSFKPNVFF